MKELDTLKEYVEIQMAGIAQSSVTESSRGAMKALANVLVKIVELQKEKPTITPPVYDEVYDEAMDTMNSYEFWRDS
jgi:hypothetical protein